MCMAKINSSGKKDGNSGLNHRNIWLLLIDNGVL